jgi:HEPN/Toprim N-terminal domain 1
MGSEAALYFENVQVDWEKNAAPLVCKILFRPSDFLQLSFGELRECMRSVYEKGYPTDDPQEQTFIVLYGSITAAERRLSILGYSRSRAEEAWNEAKTEVVLEAARDENIRDDHYQKALMANADRLEKLSYQQWQEEYARVLRDKANGIYDNSAQTHMFMHSLDVTEMAADPIMWAAIQLYAVNPRELWADVTDVIESQYETKQSIFGEDEKVSSRLSHAFGKITLLTEGVTDSRILEVSLDAFYPEARDLYSFVDFEGFRVEGGASPLARLLRGFAGAGLTDRFIAIFDNDAAGHEALALLKSVAFPPNIQAITLPDLEFARSYPTIGPTGKANADINGGAASIEIFLGQEALTRDGVLRPVRWSQWNSKADRYQGEVEGKTEISKCYLTAIKEGADPELLRRRFPDMDALLRAIFDVFA